MIGLSYEQIVEKIKNSTGISETEIEAKVKEKLDKLSNLISKEGAAHIVANELGVKVFESKPAGRLKINELETLQRNVEVLGRVVANYGVRSYKTEKHEGKLGNFMVGDETGRARVTVWNEELLNEAESLKENDLVLIKGAYIKENNGYKEIHLGSGSQILLNPPGETIETVAEPQKPVAARKSIADLNKNEFVTVLATIVQVFDPRFYEACPVCNKKLNPETGHCNEHGAVERVKLPVLNIIIDDGTENIRVVAFRDQVEQILGVPKEKLAEIASDYEKFSEIKSKLLGKQMLVTGRVVENEMYQRLEMIATNIEEAKPEDVTAGLTVEQKAA